MDNNQTRKVSFLLGVGIFIIPIVFAWFTLRKGYSTTSRVLSFGWLLAGVVAFAMLPDTPVVESNVKENKVESVAKTETKETVAVKNVSENKEYKIRSDEKNRDIKRAVEVDLKERITEQQIKNIANNIKLNDSTKYQRTFILFYIPEVTDSAWALATFDPNLVIKLIGSSKAEHEKLAAKSKSVEGNVLGQWNANWGFEYKVIIEEKEGKILMHNIFADSEQKPEELMVINVNGKKAYQDEVGKDHGEYYIINKDGDLEHWSKNGNYYTAPKIK